MGDHLRVTGEGLLSHASVCETAAEALTTPTAPTAGHLTQATTTAVEHGHALVDALAAQLTQRAIATGTTLRAAAGGYVTTDGGNGQAISTTVQV